MKNKILMGISKAIFPESNVAITDVGDDFIVVSYYHRGQLRKKRVFKEI